MARFAAVCLLLALGACGGGGGGDEGGSTPPPPPPPPSTGIGPAGGTVLGPEGAKVEIPAGALTTNVDIKVELSATGTPALPTGFSAVGQMFAFTPHGTTFAVPVTLTLPFDPASVPAGSTPALYKTNAQNQWGEVPGATFGAASVSAQVTSFSDATVVDPLKSVRLVRSWSFREYRGDALEEVEVAADVQAQGDLEEIFDFGPAFFDTGFVFDDGITVEPDGIASGNIASFADGVTYWVGTDAPLGNAALPNDPIGSLARLLQYQTFIKNAADASYKFTLTEAFLEVNDGNGSLGRLCPPVHDLAISLSCDLIKAEIFLDVKAYTIGSNTSQGVFFRTSGGATVNGSAIGETATGEPTGRWDTSAWASSGAVLWTTEDFDFVEDDFNGRAGHLLMDFSGPRTYTVDLSSVPVGGTFTVKVDTYAYAYNRAGRVVSGVGSEFETSANAWLRDPASIGGTRVTTTGLTPIDTPLPLFEPIEAALAPAPCLPGPGPDPAAGVLQFSAPSYSTTESDITPRVTVTRTGGTSGAVTATFTTSDGTAVGDVDYTPVNVSVFFADGDAVPRVVAMPIIQDLISAEPDKDVNLTLSQPGGCVALGAQTTAVLTIRDDDVPPPPERFTVGGTVTGLTGTGLVLENHTGLFLEITGNGPFTFSQLPSLPGTAYFVEVFNQPRNALGFQAQECTVANGRGVFGNANVTNVAVTCEDL